MANGYPRWKYLLLAGVLTTAVVYALPNAFPEDPAVQISHASGAISAETFARVNELLADSGIRPKSVERDAEGKLLLRFNTSPDQLAAAELLRVALDYRHITALNLAPATPEWLQQLHAGPMNLGLDLRGGVYFLLEIDNKAVLAKALQRYRDEIAARMTEDRIRHRGIQADEKNHLLTIGFDDPQARAELLDILQREMPLTFSLQETESDGLLQLMLRVSQAEIKAVKDLALQQNILTLRKRVNELGVAEPVITRQGADRIVVQLPGVQDTAQAKEILGATATLEFRMVAEQYNPERVSKMRRTPPGTELLRTREGEPVLLRKKVMLTGEYIIDAASGIDNQTGGPAVHITLDGKGAARFSRITGANVKRLMGVVFIENKTETYRDEEGQLQRRTRTIREVINTARIQEQLGKRFQITGLDSPREARKLALLLRAGSLAAPVEIIEEKTVGPSLGKENIAQGVRSIILGFLLVIVFMAVYYRVFGLLANLALASNLVLIVAIMSLIPGATLTLPGIIGIVLTVGMAVDANVLIFERIRQELAAGGKVYASIENGYRQAFSTIADANVTTLIAALVLFVFGTGPIKGFSVTLSIGILCSMFTAITGTRAIAHLIYGGRKVERLAI